MGWVFFVGHFLLGAGPLVAVFLTCIARKSFLVLLTLGSAFYWLVTLFAVSALFRGFAPLPASPGAYALFLLVAVGVQEAARLPLWRFHQALERQLESLSHEVAGTALTLSDRWSLALAHGLAHGSTHSLFFFLSWLPLCLGGGTLYVPACPAMSFFLVAALSTLGMAAVLCSGMVVAFDALSRGDLQRGLAPSAAHLGAALLTLANFAPGGCLVTVPLLLAGGAAGTAYAVWLWWQRTGGLGGAAYAAPPGDPPDPNSSAGPALHASQD